MTRRLLVLLFSMLLAGLLGHHAPKPVPVPAPAPAVYVPSPANRYVPKPSCAAAVKPGNTTSRPEWFVLCATTHGPVSRCCFSSGAAAERVGARIYDAELRAQGGVLRP
jgi:hypothetical protein